MNQAVLRCESEWTSTLVVPNADLVGVVQVKENVREKGFARPNHVIGIPPVRVPVDEDAIGEVSVGDIDKVSQEFRLDDFVAVGSYRVVVSAFPQYVVSRAAVQIFIVPVAQHDFRACLTRFLNRCFPVSTYPVPSNTRDKSEGISGRCERPYRLLNKPVIVMQAIAYCNIFLAHSPSIPDSIVTLTPIKPKDFSLKLGILFQRSIYTYK